MNNFGDLLQEFQQEHNAIHLEGPTGVKNLCRICNAIGYQDPQHFGQFAHNGNYGDLINFLEDNPGAVEAVINWMEENACQDWQDNIESQLTEKDEEE